MPRDDATIPSVSVGAVVVTQEARKRSGAFYTPEDAVASLVRWAARHPNDRLLDPSCGDGRFLARHGRSTGVDRDLAALARARRNAPHAAIHSRDFFDWASSTSERFECAAGNPPFIRFHHFSGTTRARALALCARLGAEFSGLASSWAPFLVATASLLKAGGRMAFVVPAEIGHAPYAMPLLAFLAEHFGRVQIVAIREKLFPELSEDVWLLVAEEFGGKAAGFDLTILDQFEPTAEPPAPTSRVTLAAWEQAGSKLRTFLLPDRVRRFYDTVTSRPGAVRLGAVAKVGIGYVTGANDFFHLRPSAARRAGISQDVLRCAVRNGRMLNGQHVTTGKIAQWLKDDEPVLLLHLTARARLSAAVRRYLDTAEGRAARRTYKCRNRTPWFAVPDVTVPDAFLTYMAGGSPALVANTAACVAPNSLHTVRLNGTWSLERLRRAWKDPFTALSCEIEGHPLGGGMLKVEPREAARIYLMSRPRWTTAERELIAEGIDVMRRWRHSGQQTAANV